MAAMARLAAGPAPALLSWAASRPRLARQAIGRWRFGRRRGVLPPQGQLSFQIGDLLLSVGNLLLGVSNLLLGLNQLSIALAQFLAQSFQLAAQALVFALQSPRVPLR